MPSEIEDAFLFKRFKCKIKSKQGATTKYNSVTFIKGLDKEGLDDEHTDNSMSSSLLEYSMGLLENSYKEMDSSNKEMDSTVTKLSVESFDENEKERNNAEDVQCELVSVKRKLADEFSATKPKRSMRIKKEKKASL